MEYIFKFNSLIASSIKDLPKPIVFVITAEIIISSRSALKMEKNRNSITNLCMKAWLHECTITYYTQRIKLMFFEIFSSLLSVQSSTFRGAQLLCNLSKSHFFRILVLCASSRHCHFSNINKRKGVNILIDAW